MGQPNPDSECELPHNMHIFQALEPLMIFLWDSHAAESPHKGNDMRKLCKTENEKDTKTLKILSSFTQIYGAMGW
jgi:hypothetical protein